MISKARTKFIKSLQLKKYRISEQAFVVEGTKSVLEVLGSGFEVLELYATPGFLSEYAAACSAAAMITEASPNEMAEAGSFRTNDGALAVVRSKPNNRWELTTGYGLMLDGINDPGNYGTIIRIADWFGLKGLVVSEDVPDLYNPKVIAASKGSFTRIPVYYSSLQAFIPEQKHPVFGADLEGEDVHSFPFPETGWILMGSEAHGISPVIRSLLEARLTIPAFGQAESLNAGMATAIICDNLKRITSA